MFMPIGYNLVPASTNSSTRDLLRDLHLQGYSRKVIENPLSFDQDVCPSSFTVYKNIIDKHNVDIYKDPFYRVYNMWRDIETIISYGPHLLQNSQLLHFEALEPSKKDDYLFSLRGFRGAKRLPTAVKSLRTMFDIVDRSNRSYFFAMKTNIKMDIQQNEYGLIDSEGHAQDLYSQVLKEYGNSNEMIRFIKLHVVDKDPYVQHMNEVISLLGAR